MNEGNKPSLVKPGMNTPFHIDFEWWRNNDNNWRVAMESMLCPEHQQLFASFSEGQMVDWIDPETAEVTQMDGLQVALVSHCARQPEFLDEHTVMVEAIFRVLLADGNIPKSAVELSQRLNRPAETILRTITGVRVYKGLRPFLA